MPHVLVAEELGVDRGEFKRLLQERTPSLVTWWDEEPGAAPEAVEILVTVRSRVDGETLGRHPGLRMVAVAFTGYEHVDVAACRRRGIHVANAAGYATSSVAELAIGLALTLLRLGSRIGADAGAEDWGLLARGSELSGKTVGILGLGAIGRRTAELFAAFGCRVLGCARREPPAGFERTGSFIDASDPMAWRRLFSEADLVSLHLPLTESTAGIVGKRELGWMKQGAGLINTARGGLVDEGALVQALREKRIRCALDVFETEPLPGGHPLRSLDAILTPHVGYRTSEALRRRAVVTATNISDFLAGRLTNAAK